MAVPRNRLSNARKKSRRAHNAKQPKAMSSCSNCGAARLSHTACGSCGFYKGRQVLEVKE